MTENKDDLEINVNKGDIEFKNVSFKYDTDDKETAKSALNSVNLKILGGKMTSIVGHSGAATRILHNMNRLAKTAKA